MKYESQSLKESTRILLAGLIDYAGLFPPASVPMTEAVGNYARYLTGAEAWMMGRFIVPMSRLDEFEQAAAEYLPRGNPVLPWRISVLASGDLLADLDHIADFNYLHARDEQAGAAVVDTIELKAASAEDIRRAMRMLPDSMNSYFEIPLKNDPAEMIEMLSVTEALAKVRTGGVTSEAFPSLAELARFIFLCAGEYVAFKATAGLHHPLRGSYHLTYEADSSETVMYGFLNVFLAAAFARFGLGEAEIREILAETSAEAFKFTDEGVTWRAHHLNLQRLDVVRQSFAVSYGSCSFTEPIEELQKLGLL